MDVASGLPRLVGVGAGGHARSLIDAVHSAGAWQIVGLVDRDVALWGQTILGCSVVGGDECLEDLFASGTRAAFIGVGGVGDNGPRMAIFARLRALGFELPGVQHRSAIVAPSAGLGAATVVLAGAIVNAEAVLGDNVIVNTGAIVEHNCEIGSHAHLGPGCRLGGQVRVGEAAHVGIGATVRQGISIGAGAIVAAGAVVVADVPPRITVAGVPARPLRAR